MPAFGCKPSKLLAAELLRGHATPRATGAIRLPTMNFAGSLLNAFESAYFLVLGFVDASFIGSAFRHAEADLRQGGFQYDAYHSSATARPARHLFRPHGRFQRGFHYCVFMKGPDAISFASASAMPASLHSHHAHRRDFTIGPTPHPPLGAFALPAYRPVPR